MMCTVVHCKEEEYDIYIGRHDDEEIGFWGNPYSHREGTLAKFKTRSRKESIEMFERYMLSNVKMMSRLHELKGKRLGCFCKSKKNPKSCHGDVIAKHVNALSTHSIF